MGRRTLADRFKRTLTPVGGNSLSVTLPKEYLEDLGWEKGQEVKVRYYKRTRQLLLEAIEEE